MSEFSLTEINERIVRESVFVDDLKKALGKVIVGQEDLINRILIGLLANGHILLEGVPRTGQNVNGQNAGPVDQYTIPAHPVHARYAAG